MPLALSPVSGFRYGEHRWLHTYLSSGSDFDFAGAGNFLHPERRSGR